MAKRRYPPNRLLAWERLQRGWSYEEVTKRIAQAMDAAGESDSGLTANTVRRWEIGERWPDPRYRRHLVMIYGRPAADLGLLTPEELNLRPPEADQEQLRRLCELLGDADSPSGGWDRAAVLRAMFGAVTAPVLSPLLSLAPDGSTTKAGRPTDAVGRDPKAYTQIARCQSELYWTSPPQPLFEAAYAHTQLGVGLVRGAGASSKPAFAAGLAEAADHALAAAVLGHMAFVPAFGRDAAHARSLVDAALQHTWHGVSPIVRSWLHCVGSEVEARDGAGAASSRHIELAETALASDNPPPAWMDFYNGSRLDSFAGYAALIAGDGSEATSRLERALVTVGPQGGKQQGVILADLASACNDTEQAANYLDRAIDALEVEWYGTGLNRVREVRQSLGDSRDGTRIDQRTMALVASTGPALPGG
jgi:transcriptional regulator with XRE-family HTH domain